MAGEDFDQDPHRLPVVTESGIIQGAMSRRMDGAYPSCVNPLAVWEFKCYYYTTTFGSKISDAVYIAMNVMRFLTTLQGGYTRRYSSMPTQRGWNRVKAIFAG